MNFDELRAKVRGPHIFAITPFKMVEEGKVPPVDYEGVRTNAQFFASQEGDKVIVVCAGTGEFGSLTPEENRKIVETAAGEAKGKAPLISGIGGDTDSCVEMAKAAKDAGGDAVLVMPSEEVWAKGEEEAFRQHAAIAEAVEIGIMPFRTGRSPFSVETILRLLEIPNIIGLKDESGDLDWFRDMIMATEGKLPGITGGEMLAPYYYLAGASGITTGLACLVFPVSYEQYRAAMAGDFEGALAVRDRMAPITKLRGKSGGTLVKAGLEMMGLAGGPRRDTRAVMSEEDRKILRQMLIELDARGMK